jgi:hypothetical protein
MLTFKVFERTERVELGTISSVLGKKGKIALIARNFSDLSKRVVVVLTKANGESATAVCSAQVSKLLRSKELKLSQLIGFTIIEQTLQNGETANIIAMPSGALNEITLDTLKTKEYEPVAVDWEELVAF